MRHLTKGMSYGFLPLAIMITPLQPLSEAPAVEVGVMSAASGQTRPMIGRHDASFTALKFNRWRDLRARDRVQQLERPMTGDGSKRAWSRLVRQAKALDDAQLVDWVNARINAVPYVPDRQNWGATDYWATPLEFFERGGDCEDYAIAKYSLLHEAGFPVDRMKIAVSRNHAVLLVNLGSQWSVLDNRRKAAYGLKAKAVRRFSYTINDLEWSVRI